MSSLKTRFERVSSRIAALDNLIFDIVGLIIALMLRIRLFKIQSVDDDWFLSPGMTTSAIMAGSGLSRITSLIKICSKYEDLAFNHC